MADGFRKIVMSLALVVFSAQGGFAQEEAPLPENDAAEASPAADTVVLTALEGYTGILWIRNEVYDEAPGDKGNDTLSGVLGITARIIVSGNLTFTPGILFYMENYEQVGSDGLSMPADMASAGHMTTLGLFLRIPFCFTFDLKPFRIEADVGPALWLRFPLWGPGEADRNDLFASFYKDGRFVYITGSGRLVYRIGETWHLTGGLQVYLPVANLWIQDDLPLTEGFGLALQIGIRKDL